MTDATCSSYANGGFCSSYPQTQEYCPVSCNICTTCDSSYYLNKGCPSANPVVTTAPAIVAPTTVASGSCSDTITGCTLDLCQRKPGYYYPQCKKTCNNCAGSKHIFYWMNSLFIHIKDYKIGFHD